MSYNWQQPDWPNFTYNLQQAEDDLLLFAEKASYISGILKTLPQNEQTEAIIEMMVNEAIKTSAIEGEFLSRQDVMSSIKNNFALDEKLLPVKDKRAEGIGKIMVDVRNTYKGTLTREQLFSWHIMLLGETSKINVGQWRIHNEPMQVVSGAIGREKVHFEAPPSAKVPDEMEYFIQWFNESMPSGSLEIKKAPVRAAIAHLYFETIHPFEDGNGRIGRAIAEKALSQGMGRPVLLSLSRTIESNKKTYYESLEQAQKSNEITDWVLYFVKTALAAQIQAEEEIDFILKKAKFFDRFKNEFNGRQLVIIRRMLEEGAKGFEGGMDARKYVALTRVSKATATRDMQYLKDIGAFIYWGDGKGRSTKYQVNI